MAWRHKATVRCVFTDAWRTEDQDVVATLAEVAEGNGVDLLLIYCLAGYLLMLYCKSKSCELLKSLAAVLRHTHHSLLVDR